MALVLVVGSDGVEIDDRVGLGGIDEQADDHRIVVGGAIRRPGLEDDSRRDQGGAIGLRLERRLARAVEDLVVVVEERDLVGVDVPVVHAGDLRHEARARETVVEVPELAVEQIGIRAGLERGGEVGVAAGHERRDRVLLGVGVEVAEQEHVRVAGGGQDGGVDPRQEPRAWAVRVALKQPWPSPLSRSPPVSPPQPFDLK